MVAIVERRWRPAPPGSRPASRSTHLGADGRPIPSRVAERTEIEALGRAVGRSGRGVIGINGGDGLAFTDFYDLQPALGAPITFTAVLTFPNGAHLKAAEIHRARRGAGARMSGRRCRAGRCRSR